MTELELGPKTLAALDRLAAALAALGSGTRSAAAAPAAAKPTTDSNGLPLMLPPYGKAKGKAIKDATDDDLTYYINGCHRTLGDESRAKFHDKERIMLQALEAEVARRQEPEAPAGGSPMTSGFAPPSGSDADIPFACIETRLDRP